MEVEATTTYPKGVYNRLCEEDQVAEKHGLKVRTRIIYSSSMLLLLARGWKHTYIN
ncbi:MAG: hypothetical protein QXY49_00770 [Thermofilaceae archaeon]